MTRHLVAAIAVVLVPLPLGVASTLAMLPVWRWIEQRYHIESIGHSGPSDWCFIAMFVACLLVTGAAYVAVAVSAAGSKRHVCQ